MKNLFLTVALSTTLAFFGPSAMAKDCFENGYDAGLTDGKASCQVCETCQTCPTPPNCREGDYERGVASVKLPNCQEGDYDRGVASVRLPNCQEEDYDKGVMAGKASCQICPTLPSCQEDYDKGVTDGKNSVTLPNCQEGDYDKGVMEGKNSVTLPNCQEGDYDRGVMEGKNSVTLPNCQEGDYNKGVNDGQASCPPVCIPGSNDSTDTISSADIQNCLNDASQCTGQLKAIYEAGQRSVQQSVTEEDCKMNPGNCVISSLQVFYDYFIQYRGTIGQLNFPTGLQVPPLGGMYGPAYEFRQSCLYKEDGTCLIQKTPGNGDIDQPLGWDEGLGYTVDLVDWWGENVRGEMEIVFRPSW